MVKFDKVRVRSAAQVAGHSAVQSAAEKSGKIAAFFYVVEIKNLGSLADLASFSSLQIDRSIDRQTDNYNHNYNYQYTTLLLQLTATTNANIQRYITLQ